MSAHNPTLARAFMRWMRSEGGDLLAELEIFQHRHRIDVKFRRLRELRGCLHHNRVSIAAVRKGICWDFVFDRDVVPVRSPQGWYCSECPERVLFRSREQLWIDHLFAPLRDWVLGPLKQMNCVEFVRYGNMTVARPLPDPEVPREIVFERERYWRHRDKIERAATRDELAAIDREHAQLVEAMWVDARMPIDEDRIEREALASFGPDGVAYLDSLTDDDFQPFDVDEIRRRRASRKG